MLFNCKKKHEQLISEMFEELSELEHDDIDGVVCVIRTKTGLTYLKYTDLTIDEQLVMAEHVRLDATKRYLQINDLIPEEDDEL